MGRFVVMLLCAMWTDIHAIPGWLDDRTAACVTSSTILICFEALLVQLVYTST